MFTRILIANRGEIALRIIRACKELGIESVVVFSKEDEQSLPVLFADEAICIGPREPAESYLNVPRIISAAEIAGADAIHPGYGFLAENEQFAEVCRSSGIEFIGPNHEVMRKLGNKLEARNTLSEARIPVLPGSPSIINDKREIEKFASKIGYPVILKATMGGGGRGMRVIWKKEDIDSLFSLARQEAKIAFGHPDLYLEKYVPNARHIEFQIMADNFGSIVHFGERNCSIQRRYQKLIEESPSPSIDQKMRDEMGKTAVKVAKQLHYTGAGTVEFIVNKHNNFYFMEMNTRLQVEHPVTEMVTGKDLVKDQIRVASGEPLGYIQKDVRMYGAAIECRINAEDVEKNFTSSPGKISSFHVPGGPGIRVDTHVFTGYTISFSYDSLIAKLISWGIDRSEAILRMKRALEEFVIEGVKTTIPFHQRILEHESFVAGKFDTEFIEREIMQEINK
ncbi:acetyl-CoA carboxylase biotin carboxylase subunit [Candidatus Aerophobetes bacterium]|nr:acetyl-CoA carboxylase biotin carboxylase subunit [Candidatus Aerophobetes bacterium]